MLFQSSSDYYSYKCIKNEVNNKTMWDEKSMVKKKQIEPDLLGVLICKQNSCF